MANNVRINTPVRFLKVWKVFRIIWVAHRFQKACPKVSLPITHFLLAMCAALSNHHPAKRRSKPWTKSKESKSHYCISKGMDLREYPERLAYLLIRSFHISVLSLTNSPDYICLSDLSCALHQKASIRMTVLPPEKILIDFSSEHILSPIPESPRMSTFHT